MDLAEHKITGRRASRMLIHISHCGWCMDEYVAAYRTTQAAADMHAAMLLEETDEEPSSSVRVVRNWPGPRVAPAVRSRLAVAITCLLFVGLFVASEYRHSESNRAELRRYSQLADRFAVQSKQIEGLIAWRKRDEVAHLQSDARHDAALREALAMQSELVAARARAALSERETAAVRKQAQHERATLTELNSDLVANLRFYEDYRRTDTLPWSKNTRQQLALLDTDLRRSAAGAHVIPTDPAGTFVLGQQPLLHVTLDSVADINDAKVVIRDAAAPSRVYEVIQVDRQTWKPAHGLPRGRDYEWFVRTPGGPRATIARFRVLDAMTAERVLRIERIYRDTPMFKAMLYVRLGLLFEAEQELVSMKLHQQLGTDGRKLLQTLRTARHEF
jgi:hypothetical protein